MGERNEDGRPPEREAVREREWVEPPASFAASANVTAADRDAFREAGWPGCWERAAALLDWERPYDAVYDDEDTIRWFPGGRLNASYNCVDRHVEAGRGEEAAIAWEGQLGENRTLSYRELYEEVNAFAAALRELGVEEGDVVTLYLPMIPELPVAMLACARIGAPHSVVFAGFSADALATRLDGADSEYLVTCDGYYRRGTALDLSHRADNACLSVDHDVEQIVVDRLGDAASGDRRSYGDMVDAHAGAEVDPVDRGATDLLFLIYTSGTTGEPTLVRHATGGYLAHVSWTARAVLDLGPDDTHWCSADVGWITGHSYAVYGPLALGATTVLYEGTPDHPENDRLWRIIERNRVDVFYTSPASIRAFVKWGPEHPERHDLSSLRLLGTVGEPIDETAWHWYRDHVGGGECPVVDTWWQTETGGIVISTLPGVDRMRPGAVGRALPGIEAAVVDATGERVADGEAGRLVLTRPWPGMARSLCEGTDWAERRTPRIDGEWRYDTGDNAVRDEDGYLHLLGRADDVITVSSRRLSTAEIESAVVGVEGVAEAAVVVGSDAAEDSRIHAFVSPESNVAGDEALEAAVRSAVESAIGSVAVPDVVTFAPSLPKTRSGKVVRRYLAAIASGDDLGDTSALQNPEVVGELESLLDE
ncbi:MULTISPECIES: acetate--CoA ligase [Halorussus]|uniref:acetate--CoA ligase n=1 Tax=Halorussus TaxID=1070314 RepID=UPI00209C96AD|nr:acetate--CoA ligase [Halorussus vallis]USZ74628.1 acetate--CoA ligase [Halorussus vallis]